MIIKKTLLEAKEDKQKFIDKFGEEEFNTFWNNKQKLKNMGISVDILYHVKNTSVDEMKDILTKVQETKSKNQKIKADKTGAVLLYSDDTNSKTYGYTGGTVNLKFTSEHLPANMDLTPYSC